MFVPGDTVEIVVSLPQLPYSANLCTPRYTVGSIRHQFSKHRRWSLQRGRFVASTVIDRFTGIVIERFDYDTALQATNHNDLTARANVTHLALSAATLRNSEYWDDYQLPFMKQVLHELVVIGRDANAIAGINWRYVVNREDGSVDVYDDGGAPVVSLPDEAAIADCQRFHQHVIDTRLRRLLG